MNIKFAQKTVYLLLVFVFLIGILCIPHTSVVAQGGETWLQLSPGGSIPEIRYWHGGAYDSNSNRMIIFGGGSYGHGNLNDVWVLTHANGLGTAPEWVNTVPNGQAGSPPARNLPGVTYDPKDNRLIVFGGCGGGCWPNYNDVWVLTNANATEFTPSQWVQLFPTGTAPAPRDDPFLNYDPATNRMIVFSGHDGSGSSNSYADVWVLTNANGAEGTTPEWIQLTSSVPFGGRYLGSAVYDGQNNRLIVFGGKDINANATNAVWVLTNANGLGGTPEWINLLPENAAGLPSPTAGHAVVYDPIHNNLITFGGSIQVDGVETLQNAVWKLSYANGLGGTPEWTQILPAGPAPSPRSNSVLGYDSVNQRMVLFGGHDVEFHADSWVQDFNQPMVLSPTDILVVGQGQESTTPSNGNPMLFRVDKNGNIVWEKHLPFTQLMMWPELADRNVTEDSFYLLSSAYDWNRVDGKGVIHKFDTYGNLVWNLPVTISSMGNLSANPVGGGIYLGDDSAGIYRIDTNGNILWGPLTFGCSSTGDWAVAADIYSGGVYVAQYDCNVVVKVDSEGDEVWRVSIPVPGKLHVNPLDGGVYVGTDTYARNTYRLDANGNIQWVKNSFPSPWTYPRTVSPVNGSITIVGGWPSLIARAAMDGTVLWSVTNDNGHGFGYAHNGLAADLEEDYLYTGDGYADNLGISKYSGADGSTLIWHIDPGYYSYTGGYGPQYTVFTGVPLPKITPPVLPSSFYGEIHINDNPPMAGAILEAYLPDVSGVAASTTINVFEDDLIYSFDVPGTTETEGDTVTFKIGTRVVATAEWHSGTNTALHIHPPEPVPGGPYLADEGAAINFSASANDWGNDVSTYQWDWDSNGTYDETGAAPTHTWDQFGSYSVGLKVTDAQHGEGATTLTVSVTDVAPSNVSAGGPYNATSGQLVTLTGSATCASVDTCTYEWDLDNDGAYDDATGTSPTKTWYTIGDYTVGLRVSDGDGNTVTANADVHIAPLTHTITLVPGWNLVSFNVHPSDTTIASVLASVSGKYDLIYAWDATGAHASSGHWLKADNVPASPDSLTEINEAMGFWIHMSSSGTLNVTGAMPIATSIAIWDNASGWNLVGYPSAGNGPLPGALSDLGTDFSLVYAYHANDTTDPWKLFDRMAPPYVSDLPEISPGWGYWIKVTADHDWSVYYSIP